MPPADARLPLQITGLWSDADFLKLWMSRTVSEFGLLMGALQFTAILILNATPFQMGIIAALRVAPGMLIGLFAGVIIDRMARRPILIAADLGRFALLASIPAAFLIGHLRMEHLYLIAFCQSILATFSDVAHRSYLPTLVKRSDLIAANSRLTGSESFAEVSAFSVGGWIAQLISAAAVAAANALIFLISAISLALIRKPEPPQASEMHRRSIVGEIAEGLAIVWKNPLLGAIAVATAAEGGAQGIMSAVFLVFGVRELGFGAGTLSTIFAVGGISSIIGSIYAGRAVRRFGIGTSLTAGYTLYMLSLLLIPIAQPPLLFAALLLTLAQLGDGFFTMYMINENSLRQAVTPSRSLGRVNASIWSLGLAALFIGSLLGGALAGLIGLRLTIAAAACIGLSGALWLALSPLRSMHTLPQIPDSSPSNLMQDQRPQ